MTYAVLHNRCVVSMTSYTWLSCPTPTDPTNTPPSTLCLSHLRPALAASDFGIQARRCRRHLETKSMHRSYLNWHWEHSFRPTADWSNKRQRRSKMPNVEAPYSGTTSLADSQVPGLRSPRQHRRLDRRRSLHPCHINITAAFAFTFFSSLHNRHSSPTTVAVTIARLESGESNGSHGQIHSTSGWTD